MTLAERLKTLRTDLGLSQEAMGAHGFVSTPGWIKLENGQRQASEKLIDKLCRWLVEDKHMRVGPARVLQEELLTLKYLGARSNFVARLADAYALQNRMVHLLAPSSAGKPKRGRPAATGKAVAA